LKNTLKILVRKTDRKRPFENISGILILRWILKKQGMRISTGFCLDYDKSPVEGPCGYGTKLLCSVKDTGFIDYLSDDCTRRTLLHCWLVFLMLYWIHMG
jgi:hypothetical protein